VNFFRNHAEEKIVHLLETVLLELRVIRRALVHPTPHHIRFKERTMLPPNPGNTLVFTGTIDPPGSAFPAGTTFTVTSDDPSVTPTVDETGLIVTIPIPLTAKEGEVLVVNYASSTFTSDPVTSPAQITSAITLTIGSVPPPPVPTPTGIVFNQTT
jgi:hypothetical protein